MKKGRVFGFLLLMGLSRQASAQQTYKPPQVASAGDAYVPYQVVVDGLFVLDVSLDDGGRIQKVDALRDPGGMIGAAETFVHGWIFKPASRDGKPAPSRLTVSFVYRPPNNGIASAVTPQNFSPVLPPDKPESSVRGRYVPVGVLSFAYPEYPAKSVAWGSVVVQLTVDDSGAVKDVGFLHRMEGFNNLVSDALRKWRFQAGTLDGKAITSKTIIAFVFQTPSPN